MKRWLLAAGAVAVTVIVAVAALRLVGSEQAAGSASENLETAQVTRQTLEVEETFRGDLGYGDPYALISMAWGVITWVPEEGTILSPGDVAFRVDNKPVFLAQGSLPMYRDLSWGLKGDDVRQLQRFLADAGLSVKVTGTFDWGTSVAVKAWKKEVGLPVTTTVGRDQIIFVDGPVRVWSVPRKGTSTGSDSVVVTDTTAKVTASLNGFQRVVFSDGAEYSVSTADTTVAAALDSVVAQLADEEGEGRGYLATLIPDEIPGEPGRVEIHVRNTLAEDVMAVPIRAIVALAGGRFAVEVVLDDGTTEYREVKVGETASGFAEITGDVEVGDTVRIAQ